MLAELHVTVIKAGSSGLVCTPQQIRQVFEPTLEAARGSCLPMCKPTEAPEWLAEFSVELSETRTMLSPGWQDCQAHCLKAAPYAAGASGQSSTAECGCPAECSCGAKRAEI